MPSFHKATYIDVEETTPQRPTMSSLLAAVSKTSGPYPNPINEPNTEYTSTPDVNTNISHRHLHSPLPSPSVSPDHSYSRSPRPSGCSPHQKADRNPYAPSSTPSCC